MLSRVEMCAATVVQPASEFEQIGVEELAQQTMGVLNIQAVPKDVFDRQLAFNLYPALEHNEEFIVRQIQTLTDSHAQIALLITQGTIFHSHTFSLFVKTSDALETNQILDVLRSNPAIASRAKKRIWWATGSKPCSPRKPPSSGTWLLSLPQSPKPMTRR